MFEHKTGTSLEKRMLGLLAAVSIIILMASFIPAAAAPPCGTPQGGPCPTDTPGGTDPTATPAPTSTPVSGYDGVFDTIVWSDEFNTAGCAEASPCYPDPNNWTYDIGRGRNGWGNGEWQYYTDRLANARVQDGSLIIQALEERFKGASYTSARLKTLGLHSWTYGSFEARMKITYSQGVWPAFWMLGTDIDTVGWPDSGEIDIMENVGHELFTHHGALHGPGYSGADNVGGSNTISTPLHDNFHVYRVDWHPDRVEWYLDGQLWMTKTINDVPGEWVFDHPFFILVNVAVGGAWPGAPDATTVMPQTMYIDYIRVSQ